MKIKETEQKEIGRIKLSDTQELVASIIDDEKLDLRIFVKTDSYTGATKSGLRFYLFNDNWPEFKRLIDKLDKTYKELLERKKRIPRNPRRENSPHRQF